MIAPPDAAMPPSISPAATPIASGTNTPVALRTPRATSSLERSKVTASRRSRFSPTSGIVARRERLGPMELELPLAGVGVRLDRLEQVRDVVARGEAVEDPSGEPVAAAIQDRRAAG